MSTLQLDNSKVSRHLGQTSAYARDYDPKLLVREPRQSNRKHLGIDNDNLPFCGYDVWNAYEISSMTKKGLPVAAIAKIIYPCDNKYIVESKSLKLYLNSFNMARFGNTDRECLSIITDKVEDDLSRLLETNVVVSLFTTSDVDSINIRPHFPEYTTIESTDTDDLLFDTFNECPDLLLGNFMKPCSSDYLTLHKYHSSLLKSNCRVTSQPDWGDVYIRMKSSDILSSSALLKYIVSFRDECHFHEEVVETVYKRLWDIFTPKELTVTALYTRRGGIDINPHRASNVDLIKTDLIDVDMPFAKAARQ